MADAINIPIVSKYDDKGAKAALKDAQALDKAKPEIKVTADTKAAERDITGLMKKVDLLDKDSATLLLTSNATQIARDITDLVVDLDKLDANDPQVTVKAAEINSLKGDLDQVEAKIKSVNDVPIDIDTKPARKGIDDVGKSADSSKSVLANMIGNSAQDLGALGGVAGSAGVAFGQMGEYMADAKGEGEGFRSVLSSFGAVAGPIALITTAISVLTGVLEDQKAAAAASQARIKEFGQAFSSALPNATALAQHFADTTDEMQKFNAEGEGFGGGFVDRISTVAKHVPLLGSVIGDAGQNITDLNGLLTKGGLSLFQFSKSVEQGGKVGDDFSRSLLEAGKSGKLTEQEVSFLIQALGTYGQEATKAKDQQKLVNDALIEAHQPMLELNAAYAEATDHGTAWAESQQRGADKLDEVNQLLHDQASALNEQVDAALASADATFAASDAQDDFVKAAQDTAQAEQDAAKATKEHGAQSQEAKDATDAYNAAVKTERDAMVNSANAAARLADEQAKASGTTLTAQQKIDTFNDSLLANARYATPQARASIADYIITANQVPPDKSTDIRAAINAGDFETAKRLLNEASSTRTAAIKADADTAAAERELGPQGVSRPRTSEVTANVTVRGITAIGGGQFRLPNGVIVSKHGGTIPEGWSGLAGEAGPEFAEFGGQRFLLTGPTIVPPGTQITSAAASARMLERELSGPVTNVTVQVPRGTRPDDMIRAADRYARRNGRPRAHR